MKLLKDFVGAVVHLIFFAIYILILLAAEIPGGTRLVTIVANAWAAMSGSTLGRAAMIVFVGGVVSRMVGLVREMLVASWFGAGAELDGVLLGMAAPMAITVAAGASLSRAGVPAVAGLDPSIITRVAWHGALRSVLLLVPVSALLVVGGFIVVPWWMQAPADASGEASVVWGAVLGGAALVGGAVAGLLLGLANGSGRHVAGAWTAALYNVVVIVFVVALGGAWGAVALAAGTLAAEWLQVPWYAWALSGRSNAASPASSADVAAAWRRLTVALGPALALALLMNANVVVDRAFAAGLAEGSIAALGFAERLVNLPVGLMAMAIAVPFMTRLGEFKRARRPQQSAATLRLGLRVLMVVGTAGGVVLAAFAGPVVALLFERGAFDAADTALCVRALLGYAVGTPMLAMALFLTGAAMMDARPWRLVIVLVATVALNALLNAVLAPRLGAMGIALSTSLVALVRVATMVAMMDAAWWRDGAMRASVGRALVVALALAPILAIVPAWQRGAGMGMMVSFGSVAVATVIATPVLLAEARAWRSLLQSLDERAPEVLE